MLPLTMIPGGNPTTALPGLTPTLPFTVVDPVFVTVEPASTAKGCDAPRDDCADAGDVPHNSAIIPMLAASNSPLRVICPLFADVNRVAVDFICPRGGKTVLFRTVGH